MKVSQTLNSKLGYSSHDGSPRKHDVLSPRSQPPSGFQDTSWEILGMGLGSWTFVGFRNKGLTVPPDRRKSERKGGPSGYPITNGTHLTNFQQSTSSMKNVQLACKSKWKYCDRPKIENRNGASEKTFSYTHLLRITSRTSIHFSSHGLGCELHRPTSQFLPPLLTSDCPGWIKLKKNKAYVFGNVGDEFYQVAVSNLGAESAGRNDVESLDQCRENIRSAVGLGAIALQDQGITNIFVEEFTNAEAAAESAALAVWTYQDWKSKDDRLLTEAKIEPYGVEDGFHNKRHFIAMMALYEHMPSGMALKPGDVLMARNGKTILMEDVALSGRIVAADILTFLEAFQPCLVIHKATSNTSAAPAVGYPATGVWSTSDILWEEINRAGMVTGDRFWRFPIWKYFRTQIKGVRAEMRGFGPHGSDGYRQNGQRSDHALPEKGPNDRTPYAAADSVSLPGRLSARSSQCLLLSIEQIKWVLSVGVYILFLTTFAYVATIMGTTIVVATGHYIGIVLDTIRIFIVVSVYIGKGQPEDVINEKKKPKMPNCQSSAHESVVFFPRQNRHDRRREMSSESTVGEQFVKPLVDLMKIGGLWFDFSDYKFGFWLKWLNIFRSGIAFCIWARQIAHLGEAGPSYLLDESAVFVPIGLVEFFMSVGCIYFTPITRSIIDKYSAKFTHYGRQPWAKKIIDDDFQVFNKVLTLFKIGLGGFFVFYVIVPIGFDCTRAVLGMEAYVVPLPLNFLLGRKPERNSLFYSSVAISYLFFLIIVPRFIAFGAVVVYCVAFAVIDMKILMRKIDQITVDDDETVFLQKMWHLRDVIDHHSEISIQKEDYVLSAFCTAFLMFMILQTVAFNAGSFVIENQSEELMWALYGLPWYKQPPQIRKEFGRILGQAVKLLRISYQGSDVSLMASMRVGGTLLLPGAAVVGIGAAPAVAAPLAAAPSAAASSAGSAA
ncbi:unnamed protein product [Nesidiocoris tenuis]|uniref:Cytosol aminopeptidase domain-containing protein n=1 Tax=Nesidiocoris tenuis TaxID=355587 RepID=A0A6H5HHA1_9HEMI|nr:unnamed protein product [Nesidiocoris tenuis]